MKTLIKRLLQFIIVLVIIAGAGFVIAYLATDGDYSLPETVDTDSTLPQITLDNITFHSETFGDANNPTVIVLHGGPGSDYRYLLDLKALSDEYFVVFYDQRGAGLSTRISAESLTVQDMVDDLDLFVDYYGDGEPVNIIGHSWGAMLASAYVGQYPSKVNKLVLAEPGALTNDLMTQFMDNFMSIMTPDFMMSAVPVIFESLHISDPAQRTDYVSAKTAHLWETDDDNPYQCEGEKVAYPSWRAGGVAGSAILANSVDADGNQDVSILSLGVDQFENHVLFLASECNTWLGEDVQKIHADLYSSAEVVVISDAGHYMFNDNLEDSLIAVSGYFKSERILK